MDEGDGRSAAALRPTARELVVPVVGLVVLSLALTQDYLVFHTLAELFAVVVGLLMFFVAASLPASAEDRFLSFVGAGYFWIALLDLMHALTYQGMPAHAVMAPDATTQYWMGARLLEAAVLCSVPALLHARPFGRLAFGLGGAFALVWHLCVDGGLLPVMFVPGEGLTPFKVALEYAISGALGIALVLLWRRRHLLAHATYVLMSASMVLTAVAELAFTLYDDPYGPANAVGHYLKVLSFWLIVVAAQRRLLAVRAYSAT